VTPSHRHLREIRSRRQCCTVVPVLRLGIHPEMERFAILNRSMPCTSGATMSNFADLMVRQSSAFQRFVKLSMRNAIYIFSEKYLVG
jgi:hypothetical protein